ncbi:sigma-54 interaction domain-containing protein [Noviherbaspirillum aerium]|uniref:sigma-54 interaction domain-containing protein n=1 Tax=Noviherbaspirillum aerium TaxID=2588497 RepID=UPI00124D6B53
MDEIPNDVFGLLIRSEGKTVSALGIVADLSAQEALVSALEGSQSRTMFPITLPSGPSLCLVLSMEGLQVALVRAASLDATLFDFVAAVPFAFDILEQILNDPYRGLTVADHTGSMLYVSPVHEKFLGFPHGGTRGLPAEEAIPNSRLRSVIESGKAEIGKTQELSNGVTRVVTRRPIWKNNKVIGAVGSVMFRDANAVSEMAQEINQLRTQLEFYRRELSDLRESQQAMDELIGDSQAMARVRNEIARVAKLDVPVLIIGESGTGKELVARAIHRLSRPNQALISINLAAMPSSLVESELFGYAAGAFTGGARQGRPGKVEMANDGTLFLDEVGDIPADIQIKLLRVLENHVVERLGSHKSQQCTFRLVAATHRDMDDLIRNKTFRHDLFYRISGVTLRLPPLRQRLEDIPALVTHFIEAFCQRNSLPVPDVDPSVSRYLAEQSWPGNLRQLKHRVEEALVFSGPSLLTLDAFQRNEAFRDDSPLDTAQSETSTVQDSYVPVKLQRLKAVERTVAMRAVELCGGNKLRAAQQLGISRSYLYKLLR